MLGWRIIGLLALCGACSESPRTFAPAPSSSSGERSETKSQASSEPSGGDAGVTQKEGCETHAQCDDGNICNGEERCRERQCTSGQALPNGEACNDDEDDLYVCRDGNCLESRCGDGIVDERASEVCDDGNDERNDGCDDCRYGCETAADCNDSNICNGDETCDTKTHACVAGTPLDDETTCGPDYVCRGARCVSAACGDGNVDPDEECDDGNLEGGDGCGADCYYECKGDEDCNDGNVCNGLETCDVESHVCLPGEQLDCDDGDACTEDLCDAALGCMPTLIDADGDGHAPSSLGECGTDCDDEDAEVFAGAGELCDAKDNNCDGDTDEVAPVWYPDCDGDGYAPAGAVGLQQCDKPETIPDSCAPGLTSTWTSRPPSESADCWDSHPDVYPGQTKSFSTAITGASGGQLPFDYNCNDTEERTWSNVNVSNTATCKPPIVIAPPPSLSSLATPLALCIGGTAGWTKAVVPGCGVSAEFTYCSGCSRLVEQRRQQCK